MNLVAPPVQVHGLKSNCNFTLPPLDGTLTLPEIYDFHYKTNPDHPVFVYAGESGNRVTLSYSDVVPAAHRAALHIAKTAGIDLNASPEDFPPIAIVATSDTITYFTSLVGMLRAEITVVPISPRNSVSAVANLLSNAQPSHVLVSTELPIRELAESAIRQFKGPTPPVLVDMPKFDDIYVQDGKSESLPPRKADWSRVRLISHSSGSTSFPKPINWDDRFYMQIALAPHFAKHDLCGQVIGCQGINMFHAIGLEFIAMLPSTGFVMATFEPISPAKVANGDSAFQGFRQTLPDYILGVPSLVEEWSRDSTKVAFMKESTGIIFGGSILNKAIGDSLANEGVTLYSFYGLTELGVVCMFLPDDPGKDWEYITLNPQCATQMVPTGDGSYELVITARRTQALAVINSKLNGQDAYSTHDLFVPHPTKDGRWKLMGRADDQIILSTGEKTNPGPLESILCQHPYVAAAVMFGRGRFQNGVLIEPKEPHRFDPNDEKKLIEFRNIIWPIVEEMNSFAPSHSRLFKEMILVTSPHRPFSYTPKGAPKRTPILREYDTEIEGVYSTLNQMNKVDAPSDWSPTSSLAFTRAAVNGVLKTPVADTDDIFSAGCDSLQATWIRNSIFHVLRNTPSASVQWFSPNIVYENPTITSLSRLVAAIATAKPFDTRSSTTVEEIEATLDRYTTSFPTHVPSLTAGTADKEVIFVTGTTGALGSAVLAKLVNTESVGKIFAYNRPSKQGKERQKDSLKARGYDESLATSEKVIFLEGNLTASGLGLDVAVEDEIRKTTTHIIHIAWRVDFNLTLKSFDDAIGGVRTLVDLALLSPRQIPPRLLFTSSVGVLRNHASGGPVAELPIEDPTVPLGQGYSESKWVSEMILNKVSKSSCLRPIVARLGQISGGLNGAWNTSEWVGAVIKSSLTLECLPQLEGVCSWIPLDVAAGALVDLRNVDSETVNLAHPLPIPCADIIAVFSQELSLPIVPYEQWVQRLDGFIANSSSNNEDHSSQLAKDVPAATIIGFFHDVLQAASSGKEDGEAMGIARLLVEEAVKGSMTLRAARKLGPDDVRLWLDYWRKVGFIP